AEFHRGGAAGAGVRTRCSAGVGALWSGLGHGPAGLAGGDRDVPRWGPASPRCHLRASADTDQPAGDRGLSPPAANRGARGPRPGGPGGEPELVARLAGRSFILVLGVDDNEQVGRALAM